MESSAAQNEGEPSNSTDSSPTTGSPHKFNLPQYLSENYLIIVLPSVFLFIFLLILLIVFIKKVYARRRYNLQQLETYSSVKYDDDEELDDELINTDDVMYTSCQLFVGEGYEGNSELTNSEPEYDCRSVDVSVNASESSIVDWRKKNSPVSSQELGQSLKTLPLSFWKR